MPEYERTIPRRFEGERFDKCIAMMEATLSRNQIKKLMEEKQILVDGTPRKPSETARGGEVIKISYEEKDRAIEYRALPLEIVYEDDALLVVNKPSGLIVHPSQTSDETTLVHALLPVFKDKSAFEDSSRFGIVHRLDKETSGLLLIAKSPAVLKTLQKDLKDRKIKRHYKVLLEGVLAHNRGKIDAPIGRNEKARHKMGVSSKGKHSLTRFHVLRRFENHSLVECELETGRTHQIRVHMRYIKHPVVGDATYGYKKTDTTHGQYLHAHKLSFKHPITEKELTFESRLPKFFREKLRSLDDKKH